MRDQSATRELLSGIASEIDRSLGEVLSLRHKVEFKADGSPVTDADRLLEDRIHRYLRNALEDLNFVGEESHSESWRFSEHQHVAVVDPIDGTENFCSGLKEWGTAVTLWNGADHLGSMLYLPELGCRLMTGDTLVPMQSRIRGFSSSMCGEIIEELSHQGEHRIMGCSVYNFYNVVRGSFASFTNPRGGYVWDILAGLMLAREHGCVVQVEGNEFVGQFLQPTQKYRFHVQHRYDLHPG